MGGAKFGPIAAAALIAAALPADARTLEVGPGKPYARPSEAAAVARPGDRVLIAAGEYFDCAVWPQSHLVIEGDPDGGAVITDKACQGKALFVIPGDDVTVRELTLTRARVPDGNGAGIRAEGRNLLIEQVRFVNNQDGVLANNQPQGTVRIEGCVFADIGVSGAERPTASVIAGRLERLLISDTRFEPGRGGAVLLSSARITEIDSPPGVPIVVYCHHGVRSRMGAGAVVQAGYEEVYSLAGGIDAWSLEVDPQVPRY